MLIKRKENCTFLLLNLNPLLTPPPPTETRREVQGEPQRADSLRVPCPSGVRVQPAPARTRDHAPLQTPAADLLALVTHQEDDQQVLLLILCFIQHPSSQLSPCHASLRYRWLSLGCSRSSLPTTRSLLSWNQPKGHTFNFSPTFDFSMHSSSPHGLLKERVQPSANELFL